MAISYYSVTKNNRTWYEGRLNDLSNESGYTSMTQSAYNSAVSDILTNIQTYQTSIRPKFMKLFLETITSKTQTKTFNLGFQADTIVIVCMQSVNSASTATVNSGVLRRLVYTTTHSDIDTNYSKCLFYTVLGSTDEGYEILGSSDVTFSRTSCTVTLQDSYFGTRPYIVVAMQTLE